MIALRGWRGPRSKRLTFLARGILLLIALLLLNALLWVITAIVFTVLNHRAATPAQRDKAEHILHDNEDAPSKAGSLFSVALIAWTTGLRHALDADHISAIDNATRRIMAVPRRDGNGFRRPTTVGMFFSMGHSTVVIAILIAVGISFTSFSDMDTFSDVGGIIGASISGSFLFLIGVINSVILVHSAIQWRKVRRMHNQLEPSAPLTEAQVAEAEAAIQAKEGEAQGERMQNEALKGDEKGAELGPDVEKAPEAQPEHDHVEFRGFLTRLAWPLLKVIDRPWKMFPIGILFGLGFDTASTISLLGISMIAGGAISSGATSNGSVVLLAFLFTAGMMLVDSCDSVLMICAYAWEELDALPRWYWPWEPIPKHVSTAQDMTTSTRPDMAHELVLSMTPFSMVLTLLSILAAFTISVIEILGLIGDHCTQCSDAADRQDESGDGGLAGRWWLWWRWCNDNFGYIGVGITGIFVLCMVVALVVTVYFAKRRRRRSWFHRPVHTN
ncbi:hypothetical protein MEQU1_001678 [Malassezia equina]|uniref:Nickel/cobalt efflux system n=1 Tax=Malassezia equina TaxID=1381935 RepID=A0AAF0EDJ1_9BASI|nr:hypothetical protein MEQU1_001678 [Malassezia equina]